MSLEIKGTVEDIIYKNEENGFAVAILDHRGEMLYIKGIIPVIEEGQMMSFIGSFVTDPKYGEQFDVISSEIIIPDDEQGIEIFLASGFIDGIGPAYAEKIVKKFGKESLDIIQYNPEKLLEIPGIGQKKLEKITESYIEKIAMKEVVLFLQKHGVSLNYAVKIYAYYKEKAIQLINQNPYRLAEDIRGIGFKIADTIAKKMGIALDSKFRLASGIKYVLKRSQNNGHTFLLKETLIRKAQEVLNIQLDLMEKEVEELIIKRELILESLNKNDRIYLPALYEAEKYVADRLVQINHSFYDFKIDFEKSIKEVNDALGITLHDKQKDAVKESLQNGVLVITGGPGTGKTTIINSIIKIFDKEAYKVLLAAPTGRAAKRMSETTGKKAKTIHRLLEYSKSEGESYFTFKKDDQDPLVCDVIIIDETSMVDIRLMKSLLSAITEGTRIIFVGDADQLPSVGPGNVLMDIIGSGEIKVVRLDKIFRQEESSLIVTNAHKINHGQKPIVNQENKDFFFIKRRNPKDILNEIKTLCQDRLKKHYSIDPINDIQILTPMKNNMLGTKNINQILQATLNPKSKFKNEVESHNRVFRVGDKVMQIKNNYEIKWATNAGEEGTGIFNGDIGHIYGIDKLEKELLIAFDDDKRVRYKYGQLDQLLHSYAITIHKSQGNEFPVVIIPMSWIPQMLNNRRLLYTAITRAEKLVIIIGQKKYMNSMIQNEENLIRNSGLRQKIIQRAEFEKLMGE